MGIQRSCPLATGMVRQLHYPHFMSLGNRIDKRVIFSTTLHNEIKKKEQHISAVVFFAGQTCDDVQHLTYVLILGIIERKAILFELERKRQKYYVDACLLMLWLSFFWRSLANARKSTTPPPMESAEMPLPKLVDNPPAPNSVPEPLRSKSTKTESMDPRWWWWWWWLPWCELLRNGWWQGDEVGDVMGEVNDEGGPDVNPDPDPFNPASLLVIFFWFHTIKKKKKNGGMRK